MAYAAQQRPQTQWGVETGMHSFKAGQHVIRFSHLKGHTHLVQELRSEYTQLMCQLRSVNPQLAKKLPHVAGVGRIGHQATCTCTHMTVQHISVHVHLQGTLSSH
jgi:hypothetical protein